MMTAELERAILRMLVVLLGVLVLAGCAMKMGTREITDLSLLSQVQTGITTKADLITLFGKPDGTGYARDDVSGEVETWTYHYIRTAVKPETFIPFAGIWVGGSDSTTSVLILHFRPGDDVVRKVTSRTQATSLGGL